jgi:peptide/nickel transport system ATP-binding protein
LSNRWCRSGGSRAALEHAARELIGRVHLPVSFLDRLPRELSGGQCQRVAIARAGVEAGPVAARRAGQRLDVSVQAHILDLLEELQREMGIAYVLVSHDLSVVANFAHEVLVLRNGKVVEQGTVEQIFNRPGSDYTRELIAAIPGGVAASAA